MLFELIHFVYVL